MMELIQAGGSVGIIVAAIVLVLQAVRPLIKRDKETPSLEGLLTQHDHTKILNELHRMITIQNSHLERIAVAQEAMAEDSEEIKDAITQLPQRIAASLRRGNGHG